MQQTQQYESYLQMRKEAIDQALQKYLLPADGKFLNTVEEGMCYAVCGGGKRLRPVLVMEGAVLSGISPEAVLPAACSIELLHTYSLVHDDLPAMDNDVLRRGRATCHVQFGEANAILIGDALLTRAFELLAENAEQPGIRPQDVLTVIRMLSKAAGSRGMVGGQEMDLKAENIPQEQVQLEEIHRLKTGALLEYALVSGATLGGMRPEKIWYLSRYAQHLGMVFQITDDILDVTGNQELLGKTVGSDEKNHKATYVTRYGLKEALKKAEYHTQQALESLLRLPEDTDFLAWLIESLLKRRN